MRLLLAVMFCCFSMCAEASAALEVSSPSVGGEASIHSSWTTNNSSESHCMYFCKGVCSRGNILIQTEKKKLAVTRLGRFSMEANSGDGAFIVTIKRLKRAAAGTYHCGVGEMSNFLPQEVNFIVRDASTVPPGPPPSSSTSALQTEAKAVLQASFASSTEPSSAALTLPTAQDKTEQPAATKLKDTTVVIIVSVSLALLVCGIIPLIFYRHCSSNAEGQNRDEPDYCEENADVASTQAAVRLQMIQPHADPESNVLTASQCDAVDQALNS